VKNNDENSIILIVDDNTKNLQVTGKVLKDEGYKICLAQSGAAALKLMNEQEPNIVLLDIMMPEMDGYDVCRAIRKNSQWNDIPVIFLTARNQTDDIVKGFSSGGFDYISKPFNREEMLARVRNALNIQASNRKVLEMSKTQDTMYSIIAHDLRSPFSGISQIVDFIASNSIPHDSEEFFHIFNQLQQRTHEASNLLDNLLFWTKMQREQITIFKEKINLNFLINETITLLQGPANIKNIAVHNYIEEKLIVECDMMTTSVVFRNILSNALKFTPNDGNIILYNSTSDTGITISIEDSGVGMPENLIDEIMSNDIHHSSAGTNNEQGSGLGLLLVKKFILKNEGLLHIRNNPSRGVTVSVFFPAS